MNPFNTLQAIWIVSVLAAAPFLVGCAEENGPPGKTPVTIGKTSDPQSEPDDGPQQPVEPDDTSDETPARKINPASSDTVVMSQNLIDYLDGMAQGGVTGNGSVRRAD